MLGKAVRLAILAGVLAILGVGLFRPATLVGVDAKALANSLGGEVEHARAKCIGAGSGSWRCALTGGKVNGVEYVVTTHRFGCWNGTRVAAPRSAGPVGESVSGCIGLTDMFGS
jgi:hypothetical protein